MNKDFIDRICELYGGYYDDREEDSSIGGEDWRPGKQADHKSLLRFRDELDRCYGIKLSTSKIRKILITGGRYSTELSRSVALEMEKYSKPPFDKLSAAEREKRVAERIGVKPAAVRTYMPYRRQVYNENPSENARRIKRWRTRKNEVMNARLDSEAAASLEKLKTALSPKEYRQLVKSLKDPERLDRIEKRLEK